ncbi:lipid II flippase Amj family protein [Chitinophaga nivalis]|uniref:Lipid II flippase Amj n=1 Tax=Chitinophaga nivalis TaxID=2991709 RepID=A0ABT3IVA0_9BACT|nr:lipid II flippase Amj family protein [Chitinophaga nivalis]MCW3462400.1 lipid II flippase Amj family protein [Chitinophaga nivalis]MCW3487909.1 lipid II flippase Amj family protein [Chitinophaga nivalis]
MTTQIIIVLALTLLINLIGTLAYAVRIVGVQTGRIAITFSLFNILILISRTANGFQAPLLAKTVEQNIKDHIFENTFVFQLIIFSCTLGTVLGAFLIPTFRRLFSRAVVHFSVHKSLPALFYLGFSGAGIQFVKESIKMPSAAHVKNLDFKSAFPWKIFSYNVLAVAITTIGVLSCVYAAYLNPEYRTTASNLSAVINGFATILMSLFIDPHISVLTDDVVLGKLSQSAFRRFIIYMVLARVVGTLLAQVLFLPCAKVIAVLAASL